MYNKSRYKKEILLFFWRDFRNDFRTVNFLQSMSFSPYVELEGSLTRLLVVDKTLKNGWKIRT